MGVTLQKTPSIPMGATKFLKMYPLDFEEFLIANNITQSAISTIKEKFYNCESLAPSLHETIMNMFKKFLIVGGLPLQWKWDKN